MGIFRAVSAALDEPALRTVQNMPNFKYFQDEGAPHQQTWAIFDFADDTDDNALVVIEFTYRLHKIPLLDTVPLG